MIVVPPPGPVMFQGRAIANQTIASTGAWVPVALGAEDFDDANGHILTGVDNSKWFAPRPGVARCRGSAFWNVTTTVTAGTLTRQAAIVKNGAASIVPGSPGSGAITSNVYLSVPTIEVDVPVATGDYIELRVLTQLANSALYGDGFYGSMLRVEMVR